VNKKSSTYPHALVRPQTCAMRSRSHVKNDLGEKMVVQFDLNVLLNMIYPLSIKCMKKKHMPLRSGEGVLASSSNGLKRIMDWNCSHPSPLIKTSNDSIKIWQQ